MGCDVLSSALGMDKIMQKRLFDHAGLPIVDYLAVQRHGWRADPAALVSEIEDRLSYPLFVKPAGLGSSVGISKANSRVAARASLESGRALRSQNHR